MKNKNIYLMYTICLLQGMVFYASIATTYRLARGISLLQMGIIEAVFTLMMVILEIPWGYICYRIGYKNTLIICNGLYFISKIVFYFAFDFKMFLLERILLAIVSSGISGCDIGYLYECCDGKNSTKVFAYYNMLGTFGLLAGSIVFSLYIRDNIDLSGYLTIFPYLLAFVLTLFLDDIKKEKTVHIPVLGHLAKVINDKSLLLFLLASTLLCETTHELNTFLNQILYQRVNINIKWFGILYASMMLIGLSGLFLERFEKHFGKDKLFDACYLIGIVSCFILFITRNKYIVIIMIALTVIIENMYIPLKHSKLNEQIEESDRATILSIYSLITNMLTIITSLAFGYYSNISIDNALLLSMIFVFTGWILYKISTKNISKI